MRDGDDGPARRESFERHLDLLFRFGIERGRGFVEEQDRRILQERAGDGETLLLSAREHAALVADGRFVSLRLRDNEVMRVSRLRCGVNFHRRRVEPSELDVFEDRIVKQKRFLGDEADLFVQRFLGEGAKIVAIEAHHAARRIVETQDQR